MAPSNSQGSLSFYLFVALEKPVPTSAAGGVFQRRHSCQILAAKPAST